MARQTMDNAYMNSWSERVEKELRDRLKWHKKYSKAFAEDGGQTISDPQAETIRRYVKRQLNVPPPVPTPPKTRLSDQIKADRKKQEDLESTIAEKKVDVDKLFEDMRPASRATQALLYKGFSKIGEGRHSYLEARKNKGPEQKYKFPLTGNWEYGWNINKEIGEYKPPTHGRSHIIQESFYRTNGATLL
ncbi:protein SPMIP1-like [Saccoglossus kowalevskii]|uniref:Uncharacterized protein LOC100379075 n=1 Tax=Saccoglossus kowalevskii TaxID=10224 RepID=A0ABM0GYE5_SACKO|nr:PREDICTED: uncharacterized protein LOC100379075 [Saccoglossus kowalevskii]